MEAYTSFAEVYDTFMDNVPYEEWADYLEDRLKEYGIRDGLVLELGCGTGSMTELLAEKGYDMIIPKTCWKSQWKSVSRVDMISFICYRICRSSNYMEQ